MIFGTDVSHHQGTVDFEAMRLQSNMMFSIVKCTEGAEEGTPFLDPKFDENWQKLLEQPPTNTANGMFRGAYHFARYDNRQGEGEKGGENEAKWFCKNMLRVGHFGEGALAPALDLEKYGGTPSENLAFVRGFIRVVEAELGRSPMFYTGPNVWDYQFGDSDEFIGYQLWEVKYKSYGDDPDRNPPRMTKSNELWPWQLWQWSGGGEFAYYEDKYGPIAGVKSGVADVNRFDGSYGDLAKFAQPYIVGDTPVPPDSNTFPVRWPQEIDLETLSNQSSMYVARVQGLLLAHGYGPDGLVGSNGLPDGKFGKKTKNYLEDFKAKRLLTVNTVMTLETWYALVLDAL